MHSISPNTTAAEDATIKARVPLGTGTLGFQNWVLKIERYNCQSRQF